MSDDVLGETDRGIGKDDVDLLMGMDEVRPQGRDGWFSFPSVNSMPHRAVLLEEHKAGDRERQARGAPQNVQTIARIFPNRRCRMLKWHFGRQGRSILDKLVLGFR